MEHAAHLGVPSGGEEQPAGDAFEVRGRKNVGHRGHQLPTRFFSANLKDGWKKFTNSLDAE